MNGIHQRVASLSSEKRALFARRNPLSFAQERLWFLDQLMGGSPVYNIATVMSLSGPLDVGVLERSLAAVLDRHEVLRTVFISLEGRPCQVVDPEVEPRVPVVDLSGFPGPERDRVARESMAAEARRPFCLARGPLLRLTLLRLGDEEHLGLLTLHHIVSDGWSMGIFVRELAVLYRALLQEGPPLLPPLPIQYRDYACWQRRYLQGEVLEAELRFWKEQLGSSHARLNLPTDRPRPPTQSFRGSSQLAILPAALAAALKEMAIREGATLSVVLQTSYQVLLSRYSDQIDFSIGNPIAGRNRLEVEGLIGLFINTLVVRADLSGDPSFLGLLARVRERSFDCFQHQDLPFERLVEELEPERSPNQNPLVQVLILLQNFPQEPLTLEGGLTLRPVPIKRETTNFDLTLSITESGAGLAVSFQYSTDLFDDVTVQRMLGHLQVVLQGAAARPGQLVSRLPLLTEPELQQLSSEWNGGQTAFPRDRCLHELFAAQVESSPNAVAVVSGLDSLTYRELGLWADRLARRLRRRGVGPETIVGVCLERSLELVPALLAILKAGGAYLPLDPAYPKDRLAFLLQDSDTRMLLTERRLVPLLPEHGAEVVLLDNEEPEEPEEVDEVVPVTIPVRPRNLAYVIYTSGSTGRPRGVLVSHENVVRLLTATQDWFGFGPDDVWTLFHSFAFDFSVWEMWGALTSGGQLVVVPSLTSRSPEAFRRLLHQERVTVLNQTPSAFRQLVWVEEELGETAPLSLRLVIFGGEALELRTLKPWVARHGAASPQLVNMYGITETTVHVTYRPLSGSDVAESGGSVIGQAIPDLRLRVLGHRLEPAPAGTPGELCVGGAGLARGYLNRPELTAQKFIPDPFAEEPGARLYRSGDLVRYLRNGDIEYLGRIDHQVKVRGFRIELAEIEAVLVEHPGVRQAAILVREDVPGDKRLVAYVIGMDGMPSPRELRDWVQGKLPDFMVPSAFVPLREMPLTVNGKLDRAALPGLAPERSPEQKPESPRGPVEEMLQEIWAEVLKLERVGLRDNFFEVGGYSLLATQVVSRVRQTFGVEVPLRSLFERPTILDLAAEIERAIRVGGALEAPPLVRVSRQGDLPLSFAQQRLWFLDQLEPGSSAYNMPSAFRLHGALNVAALEWSLKEEVRRHEVLRTTFDSQDGVPVQRIGEPHPVLLPVVDLGGLAGMRRESEVRRLADEEARRPFGLAQGPLLRTTLLALGREEHAMLLTLHHIVTDGWSMGLLVREVTALYDAFWHGRPSPLTELPFQYADFALWQRQWLQGEVLEAELSFWRGKLQGSPSLLELPTDRPRPPVQSYQGHSQAFGLSGELTNALRTLSRQHGVTLFMTLVAAFQLLLSRYTTRDDISVGTPIAGRNRLETEALIGFFVNTLVLRGDLSDDPQLPELLVRVREMTLGAYAHQDVPFEKLVEVLQPERDPSYTPLFQVMLALQNASATSTRELPGLTLEPLAVDTRAAKFDLTLALTDLSAGGLFGGLEHDVALFDPSTTARMLEHLRTLLEEIVADPRRRLSDLPFLPRAERAQLLVEWNATASAGLERGRFEERLIEQVERTPEAVAVVCDGHWVTYAELDRRAGGMTAGLQDLELGPEALVAVLAPRGIDLLTVMLAILKAGYAYLPLDPSHPAKRSAQILEQSGARLILAPRGLHGEIAKVLPNLPADLPPERRPCVLDPTELSPHMPPRGAALRQTLRSPASLAYVIYTSGSTGVPKGAMVEHRGMINHLDAKISGLGLGPRDVIAQTASQTFDISVWQFLAALLVGGRVHIFGDEIAQHPVRLLEGVARCEISVLQVVPSLLAVQIDEAVPEGPALPALRWLVPTGEALPPELCRAWLGHYPEIPLVNAYGPTECSDDVTHCFITEPPGPDKMSVPIGRALANLRLYVLDPYGNLLPIGVVGQLGIAGTGVGRGYLNNPPWTAEVFVPDPFGTQPGGRLYLTGDLCRFLPDGALQFVGRIDDQVKVRSFRIELGEIEAVLSSHPAVREAVAMVHRGEGMEKLLVAYLIPRGQPAPAMAELRGFLRERLPDYLVPSVLKVLEVFPRNVNGKVDKRALPAPDSLSSQRERAFAAPRTTAEEIVAGIWSQILRTERVGVNDNFFDLGGHSLLATQIITRVQKVFQVELPLRVLFERPTIADLVGAVADRVGGFQVVEEIASIYRKLEELSDDAVREMLSQA
jgi:amino acid adenylation domain-containing protein